MIISLNSDNWILKGLLKNQWKMFRQMETGVLSIPVAGPVKATVPGAVQADLLKAGLLDDWNYGLNSRKAEWVEHREWSLEYDFEIFPEAKEDKYTLCFDGLDHSGIVKLNENIILEFNGMHRTWQVDITSDCVKEGKNYLYVLFFQPPEVDGQIGYTSRKMELKSRFNYTWDWCPRIVNIGIWRDVYIKSWSKANIKDFYPKTIVAESQKSIDIHLTIESIESGTYTVEYNLSRDGKVVLDGEFSQVLGCSTNEMLAYKIEAVEVDLWWPNGFGSQNIYDIEVKLIKDGNLCDTAKKSVGFRKVCFAQNVGAPENALPYTAVINDKNIFIRGLNWVPISPLYGTVTRDDYKKYLLILKDMNINMLRVWGGAMLESKDFYSLCDEYGIMVWQEFPQSSSGIDNTPCEESAFIDDLLAVAKEHILQRRHNVCLVIWCGGNELMWHNSIPVDTRSSNINSLKNMVLTLDNDIYFLPASPSGNTFIFNESQVGNGFNHDVHGPWDYLGDGEHYRISNIDDSLFSSEIGCTAMPRLESLQKYSNGMKLWPPDKTNPYYVHRGSWWLRLEQLSAFFGKFADDGTEIQDYVNASRYIQAESLGYSAQAARRAYPQRSGFIVWMGNEPFPNSSNTSVIEFDGTAKPAYYRLKSAFASIDVSAKYEKIAWKKGENFSAKIYAVSDQQIKDITIMSDIYDSTGEKIETSEYKNCDISRILEVGEICFKIQNVPNSVFLLRVQAKQDGKIISRTDYVFTVDGQNPFQPILAMEKIKLDVAYINGIYKVSNKKKVAAIGIFGYIKTEFDTVNLENGYFNLLPNEEIDLIPSIKCSDGLVLEGMNIERK